jgi:hypothetical protein
MNDPELDKINYTELTDGYEYPVASFAIDARGVAAYVEAVNDTDNIYVKFGVVPPLAVAARALVELAKGVISPAGTVHSTQELDFRKPICAGEQLKLKAKVEKKLDRGDLHLLTTSFQIINGSQYIVITGKITVVCQAAEGRWMRANVKIQQ